MDPELQRLFYKRVRAKYRLDLDLGHITPLLEVGQENAGSLVFRIDGYIKEVDTHVEDFKLTHRGYVERIIESASWSKDEINPSIVECNDYLKEVLEQV